MDGVRGKKSKAGGLVSVPDCQDREGPVMISQVTVMTAPGHQLEALVWYEKPFWCSKVTVDAGVVHERKTDSNFWTAQLRVLTILREDFKRLREWVKLREYEVK